MRTFVLILTLFLATTATADNFAITDVNVIPMDEERVLAAQTVLIADGHIARIGASSELEVPASYQRIDGEGRYLMPGLAEMHAHIPPSGNVEAATEVLTLYLTQGLTTVRGMLGHPAHLKMRQQQLDGELDGPRIFTSSPSINGNSVQSPEHGRQLVRQYKEEGYDLLKIHPGLTLDEFNAVAAEANQVGIPFAGHVPADVGAMRAIEAGQASIDHMDGFAEALVDDGEELQPGFFGFNVAQRANIEGIGKLAAALNKASTWIVPTEALMVQYAGANAPEVLAQGPGMQYVSAAAKNQWQNSKNNLVGSVLFNRETADQFLSLRRQMIDQLHDAGVGFLLGSDAPQVFNVPGFSTHHELEIYVQAGLSPYEALATGSVNVARYFGVEHGGMVKQGYQADLVLLDANPLEDISNSRRINGVMVAGRWYDRQWLDNQLAAIEKKYAE